MTYPTPFDLPVALSVLMKPCRTGPKNEKWVTRSVEVAEYGKDEIKRVVLHN